MRRIKPLQAAASVWRPNFSICVLFLLSPFLSIPLPLPRFLFDRHGGQKLFSAANAHKLGFCAAETGARSGGARTEGTGVRQLEGRTQQLA